MQAGGGVKVVVRAGEGEVVVVEVEERLKVIVAPIVSGGCGSCCSGESGIEWITLRRAAPVLVNRFCGGGDRLMSLSLRKAECDSHAAMLPNMPLCGLIRLSALPVGYSTERLDDSLRDTRG